MESAAEKRAFELFAKAEALNTAPADTATARKGWVAGLQFCCRTLLEATRAGDETNLPPVLAAIKYRRGGATKWNRSQVVAHDQGKAVVRTKAGHYHAISPRETEIVVLSEASL